MSSTELRIESASPPRRPAGARRDRVATFRRGVVPYAFLAPAGILFLLFSIIPIIGSVFLSTRTGAIANGGRNVGLDNYSRAVSDPQFTTALKNTALFTLGTVPVAIALGLLLAIMLNRPLPFRAAFRTIFFAPMVASSVGVAVVMGWIFNADYGVVNNFLAWLGLGRVPWLTNGHLALVTLVLAVLWSRIGFCMVLYLGALQSIPEQLVEASSLDGATRWQHFRYMTWPLLAPTTFFLIIINVIFSLQVFDLAYVLTGGGPGFSTTTLVQFIFRAAFARGDMGFASSVGVMMALFLVAFTLVRWQVSKRSEDAL